MKLKTIFICEKCSYNSQKWIGKCPECEAWNSFYEEVVAKNEAREHQAISGTPSPLLKAQGINQRISTQMAELDAVLGGGIIEGSLIILSGEPGIGKSTLTLKICESLAAAKKNVLYVSGEESQQQISLRAQRMGIKSENINFLAETNLENILATIENTKPGALVLDSIQVVSSGNLPSISGSINQVRFCAESLMNFAKKTDTPVILIGHVTKDGTLAGPRVLEHLVDVVLFIEGERYQNLRLVRSLKNRFGSTNEVGIFEMTDKGMNEVSNPSRIFLEGRRQDNFGSAITATVEGTRPILLEVQALTNFTSFGYPKRTASGFDLNRLQLLIAVIQKHLKFNLNNQDVYVNVAGGLKINDPASDLAVAMAIISSLKKEPLPNDTVYLGEIGLGGELRSIVQLNKRITEAEKLGFLNAIIPVSTEKINAKKIKIAQVEDLQTALAGQKKVII
jgi:DNA repair protein RadA/Sms